MLLVYTINAHTIYCLFAQLTNNILCFSYVFYSYFLLFYIPVSVRKNIYRKMYQQFY